MLITVCNRFIKNSENCLIIIGTALGNSLEKISSSPRAGGSLIYYCYMKEHVRNIPFSNKYEIIIDFNNVEAFTIIVDLLNHLMKYDCSLHVSILDTKESNKPHMESCMNLLRKLKKNNLIELETIKNQKEKVEMNFKEPLKNVCFFIGPGNTGKSSIISTISELFEKNNKRVALLDVTNEHKLTNYFTEHSILKSSQLTYVKRRAKGEAVDLYLYDGSLTYEESMSLKLAKIIEALHRDYDYVFVNTDEHVLEKGVELFQIPERFFVVHDCMLNKIDKTHDILLKLNQAGINMKKASMIYNKIAKKACDMGKMEEKLVFVKDSNDHLIPLIDIHCRTLEIHYNEKIMTLLNKKIMTKAPVINAASKNYITNIDRLYKCINNQADCEYSDLQFCEYVKYHMAIVANYYIFPRFRNDILTWVDCILKAINNKKVYKAKKFFNRLAGTIIQSILF